MSTDHIASLLGDEADSLLGFDSPKISRDRLTLTGPDAVTRNFGGSDRNIRTLGALQRLYGNGRLGGSSVTRWRRRTPSRSTL